MYIIWGCNYDSTTTFGVLPEHVNCLSLFIMIMHLFLLYFSAVQCSLVQFLKSEGTKYLSTIDNHVHRGSKIL